MADNIQFIFLNGTSSYQLDWNPYMYIWFEHIQEVHVLGSGLTKKYHRGFKLHAELTWQDSILFRGEQYEWFRRIYNLHDDFIFNPTPDSHSGASFGVQWMNDFDFRQVEGVTPFGYEGSMILEGTSILAEIPEDIVWASD